MEVTTPDVSYEWELQSIVITIYLLFILNQYIMCYNYFKKWDIGFYGFYTSFFNCLKSRQTSRQCIRFFLHDVISILI